MGYHEFKAALGRHVLTVGTRRDLNRMSNAALADVGLRREQLAEVAADWVASTARTVPAVPAEAARPLWHRRLART